MFPLHTTNFPTAAPDLARLMNESVQRVFATAGSPSPITVEDDSYPALQTIRIQLDNARLRPSPPRPPAVSGERKAALSAKEFALQGTDVALGPVAVDLHLVARDIRLDQARDAEQGIVLLLQSAAAGHVKIAADKADLEKAIAVAASHEAGRHGVTIEDVKLDLRPRGPRSLEGEVQLKAKKLFFNTVIRVAARLDLDVELNATISGLACRGDGAIGTLACGVLAPHLQKLDGRSFSLLALPLGEIRLRDVRLSVADKIEVQAEFGV